MSDMIKVGSEVTKKGDRIENPDVGIVKTINGQRALVDWGWMTGWDALHSLRLVANDGHPTTQDILDQLNTALTHCDCPDSMTTCEDVIAAAWRHVIRSAAWVDRDRVDITREAAVIWTVDGDRIRWSDNVYAYILANR